MGDREVSPQQYFGSDASKENSLRSFGTKSRSRRYSIQVTPAAEDSDAELPSHWDEEDRAVLGLLAGSWSASDKRVEETEKDYEKRVIRPSKIRVVRSNKNSNQSSSRISPR